MSAKVIPGEGEIFKGYVPAVRKLIHVTFGTATANPDVVVDAIAAYTLVDVTVPIIVFNTWSTVEEAVSASVTAAVGDTGSSARYNTDTGMVTGTTGAVLVAGALSVPFYNSAGNDIEVTIGGATVSAGLIHVYVDYCELHD